MQAISLNPQHRLIVSKQIMLCVLALLTAVVPILCLPVAMIMPLFSCPLVRGKEQWTAYSTAPLPALSALLYGGHPVYAGGVLLAALLPVVITAALGKERTGTPTVFFIYTMCAAAAAAVALSGIRAGSGLALPELAAKHVVSFVMEHPKRAQLLYQAMAAKLLPIPAGYNNITIFTLLFDPVFLNELKQALTTRVEELVNGYLPALLANGSIILGLFTGLRVQRLRNAVLIVNKDNPQKICVAVTPGFSMLRIPNSWHPVLLLFMLIRYFALSTKGIFPVMAMLCYYTFETVYQLQGAAVLCDRLIKKDSDRRIFAGIAAAALYVLVPFVLFIIGCFDRLFSFRRHTEDDNQETDNHEEEEP